VEVRPPVPQIPPPQWEEVKDLQEWVKYHQERPDGDQTSAAFAGLADRLEHFPGGWLMVSRPFGARHPRRTRSPPPRLPPRQ